jgi:predicted RND superfamily exporter protein
MNLDDGATVLLGILLIFGTGFAFAFYMILIPSKSRPIARWSEAKWQPTGESYTEAQAAMHGFSRVILQIKRHS